MEMWQPKAACAQALLHCPTALPAHASIKAAPKPEDTLPSRRNQTYQGKKSNVLCRQTQRSLDQANSSMSADDVAVRAASPDRSALGRAQSVEMGVPNETASQVSPSLAAVESLLLPHMYTLTKAQQPFTDYKRAVNVLASSRKTVELKRLLPSSKRDDCLKVIKRLLDNLKDDEAIQNTLRVLDSLQYDKTQLQASRLVQSCRPSVVTVQKQWQQRPGRRSSSSMMCPGLAGIGIYLRIAKHFQYTVPDLLPGCTQVSGHQSVTGHQR